MKSVHTANFQFSNWRILCIGHYHENYFIAGRLGSMNLILVVIVKMLVVLILMVMVENAIQYQD